MVRKSVFAIGAILASIVGVSAADMPVKAPPQKPIIDIYATSGFYIGAGVWGEVGTVHATAPRDVAQALAAGAAGNAVVGFVKGFGNWYMAIELGGNYAGLSTSGNGCSAVAACAFNTKYGFEQTIKVGTSNPKLLSFLPSFNFESLLGLAPAGDVVNPLAHYYVMASLRENDVSASYGLAVARKWADEWSIGAGMVSNLTPRLSLDKWAKYTSSVGTIALPGTTFAAVRANQKVLVGITVLYSVDSRPFFGF